MPEVSSPATLLPAAEDVSEDDLYIKMKRLCRQLDFLQVCCRQVVCMRIISHP